MAEEGGEDVMDPVAMNEDVVFTLQLLNYETDFCVDRYVPLTWQWPETFVPLLLWHTDQSERTVHVFRTVDTVAA